MGTKSKIEWTDATWNPVTGCTKISRGCQHCYAERMANRLQGMGSRRYRDAFAVRTHPYVVGEMYSRKWKGGQKVFVCSMSDLFHEGVSDRFIADVFDAMLFRRDILFQVLTKRTARMREWIKLNVKRYADYGAHKLPDHIWIGTSVEDQPAAHTRVPELLEIPASVLWLSIEPLLGPVVLRRMLHDRPDRLSWVVVGGESGPGARYMDPEWVRTLRNECNNYGVPFFFKQWGGTNKKKTGRVLDGIEWNEFPEVA